MPMCKRTAIKNCVVQGSSSMRSKWLKWSRRRVRRRIIATSGFCSSFPDGTRTAPVGLLFQTLHQQIGGVTKAFDVLIALGTHQPMSEAAICQRLDISEAQRNETYRQVQFFNHAWDKPAALKQIGTIPGDEIKAMTDGLFAMDVPVEINRMVFDYDQVIIIGPVFPARSRRFFRREQISFPRRERSADFEFFPLARRRGDEPDDHRQQMDARPQSGGSRRRDGQRGQALFLHGG